MLMTQGLDFSCPWKLWFSGMQLPALNSRRWVLNPRLESFRVPYGRKQASYRDHEHIITVRLVIKLGEI